MSDTARGTAPARAVVGATIVGFITIAVTVLVIAGGGQHVAPRTLGAAATGSPTLEEGAPPRSLEAPPVTVTPVTQEDGRATGGGSEVTAQPDAEPVVPPDGSLPGLDTPEKASEGTPLVTAPLPRTASRRGAIVAGFPVRALPPVPGSTVRSSSVASSSGVLQVSIIGDSRRSPDQIVAFYRSSLAVHGFVESVAVAPAGRITSHFDRSADHLVVTTTAGAGATSYTVFGSLRASVPTGTPAAGGGR